jgi:hypothetical protein
MDEELRLLAPLTIHVLGCVVVVGGARGPLTIARERRLSWTPVRSTKLLFREDGAVAELLAEDLSPPWLACLGRIRRLWPSSPLPEAERQAPLDLVGGQEGDDDRAIAFWRCLCLAETPDCPEALVHAARRRIKQLHPGLHVAFMRRLSGSSRVPRPRRFPRAS